MLCKPDNKQISCVGPGVIKILEVFYGRNSSTICPGAKQDRRCSLKVATEKVKAKCEDQKSCMLSATNFGFTDPCRGVDKYMRIKWLCKKL